jgi:hypothetical protein
MGEIRVGYRVFVWRREGRRTPARPRHRWEDNIKINLQVVGGGMGRIDLAQDKDRWWAVLNALMNFLVPYNVGNFLPS